jgi:hypothetical protein
MQAKEDYAGPMPDPLDNRLNITIKEWGRSLNNCLGLGSTGKLVTVYIAGPRREYPSAA